MTPVMLYFLPAVISSFSVRVDFQSSFHVITRLPFITASSAPLIVHPALLTWPFARSCQLVSRTYNASRRGSTETARVEG